ncbi:uncharacterized protein LOC108152559 isoform X3 [Drosophila miranda]|uniref:uncharacterized protein LOC108152559 isoform X3 n=1 Tax=Drosophila miranda TaxID=7229 RepID=UPI0007E65745|nr:uncharacterized protein LOC108152559 isoform X3 [Drosophila miranda]
MLLRRSPHSGIPKKSPGGRTPSPSSSPSPSPSRPSSHPTMPLQLQLLLLLCLAFVGHVSAQFDRTISEQESKSVVLPCPVNEEKCGKLHSLNWFKGDDRIAAMLLGDSNVTSVNKEFEDRVTVEQNPYRLVIKDLKIGDEDIYLCDTTFFIPEETCDNFNGYRVELRVLVPPTEVVILDAKGDRIENGSVVGPMQERQALKATCTVKNTRPQPDVGWFRGTKRLATYSPTHDLNDGLYTSTLELDWQLSREDLAQDIECRVESAAIKSTIVTKFSVDLQVRPTSILIKGVEHHTVQGSKVVLQCDIHGARPAVNLTWYNTTSTISAEENDLTEIRTKAFEKEDGTYHTQSELVFNASRFENDRVFKCEAENIVLQINREKPIASSLTLEVLYPPVVKVSPPEMVTNTSEIVLLNCEYFANPASLTQVVWYRNGDIVNVNDTDHYQGGNSENVALVIKSTDKEDVGNYSCQLSNSIGKGISEQQIDLDVQYVPVVEVLMIPEGPVKESDESNVTLFCNILEANPSVLTKVRWYANATLLKELPDCEETREDLCHIDPSKLLLESIGRGFFYNYSCEGFNAAGWGPRSEEKELMVHYEPGPATLTHFPPIAVKKKSVIFSCSVDDPGYPESNRYRWLRGGRGPLQDIVTKDWTVEPVGLDSRTNYSCYAYNEGGKGVMATVNLEVHAPPFFIKNLPQYTGVLHSTRNANLTCRIECVPRCEISWQKDGTPIEKNDTRYFVKEKYMDASPATGDFESMLSVLHFNMSNWANSKFDILADSANYTCVSTANSVGPGIRSGTYLGIEYAPINTTVANATVYVQEDTIPGRVICKSFGNPEPSYEWRFKDKTITRGSALIINTPMQRNDNGTYTCVAFNKHGKSTAETVIEVQFKPRCEIERREIDDQDTLICTAFGNPVEADFSWSIKAENETVEYLGSGDEKSFADKSFYVLQEDYAIARTYRCVANNTVGSGAFCEIEVAEQLAWWQRWEKTTLIILVAAILGLLLAVIIICCIIICVCRRRRRQDKYHTEVSISASQSVLSYQPVMPKVGAALPILDTSASLLPATLSAANRQHQQEHQQQRQRQQVQQQILAVAETETETETENNNEILSTPPPVTRFNGNAPKSPPRWPLRPGVMLHVSSDTKENLAVNRMTLKPHSNTSASATASGNVNVANASQLSAQLSAVLNESQTNSNSTMLTEVTVVTEAGTGPGICPGAEAGSNTLGAVTRLKAEEHLPPTDEAETAPEGVACLESLTEAPAPAAASSSSSSCANASKMERILSFVFKRTKKKSSDDGTRDSQRSHVGLLQTFWRGRGGHNDSTTSSPFGAQHRLKGIRCSGSVTYKKTPAKSATNETTTKAAAPTAGETAPVKSPSSAPSRASVTFQAPSLDKETDPGKTIATTATDVAGKALAIPSQGAHSSSQPVGGVPATSSLLQQQQQSPYGRSGRTPPPRPPPPTLPLRPPGLGLPQKALLKGTSSPFSGIPIRVSSSSLPLAKRSILVSSSSPSKVEHVQIHDKSSSLGEPLTEPGEYENLPFHGLQTAPNKFSTTPTNFNNNTNVVRVAPRPKRLNGSISQPSNSQQQQLQQQHHHQTLQHPHPHQQQHYCDLQQQQQQQQQQHYNHQKPGPQYSTMHHLPAPHNQDSGTHQVQYNLSNCFPKSYTEYYQQHQQHQQIQKQQLPPAMATTQQQQQKFNTNSSSNVQLLNAIEHDYQPTYAVVERVPAPPPPPVPSTALLNTNPFLAASNFRKYDATGEELHGSVSGSMQRGKKTKGVVEMDKKFYSLKFPGGGGTKVKKPAAYNGNISTPLGSTTSPTSATDSSSASKCKRHHSFAGNSHSDIDSGGKPMRLYDPPVYENVAEKCHVDAAMDMGGGSSNLHTNPNLATVQLHTHSGGGGGGSAVVQQKKKHHHRHHQQKNDPGGGGSGAEFQLMEPERLSIYRSDSGISNSSYESQLPSGLSQQQHRPSKAHKSGAGAGAGAGTLANASASGALCRKTVYINMEGQCAGLIHADSPTHVHSSYESASSTSHVGGGGGGGSALAVDPTSLSSCTSLYSSGTSGTAASLRFSRHQHQHNQAMANEITTPEDFEQYQLGHHPTHSASTLSVASSLNASGRGKCKAGPPPQYSPHETNKTLATNPFLANKRNNGGVGGGCLGNKKLRRQTISDPYAHIKRRQYDGYANAAADYDVDTNITRSHNSEAPNAHGDSCPTKSASVESAATATSAARQQQIGNSNTGFSHIKIGNGASASVSASVSASASASGEHQAQLLMPNELLLQASRLGSFATVDNLRYIPPLTPVNGPLRRPLADGGAYDCLVVRRPIRLPLRKHHTFHFQSNQTANGRLQQLRQQLQHQQREREHLEQDVGSLVYRPLALNERHAFKPISPTPAMAAAGPEEAEESEAQEQQQQQPQQQPPGTTGQLNPAASLEALELLTKTHPDFMFPRSSYPQNEPTTEEGIELSARPSSAQGTAEVEAEVEEDEDLGYSFCEEEYMVDNDNDNDDASSLQTTTAPTNTPVRSSNQESAIANATAGALKYFMTQSYREVHI